VANSISANSAPSSITASTPAKTVTVPNARMIKPKPGSRTKKVCSCRSTTSWSLSPCRKNSDHWLALTRRSSIASCFALAADALLELTSDPRFVGAKIGMVGVLHAWTRDLFYHPHIHYIATGGGLSDDGRWLDSRPDFLIHVKPLSILFRAKFRDQL